MDKIMKMAEEAMGGQQGQGPQYGGYEQEGRPQHGYGGGQNPPPGYPGQGEQYGERPQGYEGGYGERPQQGGYEQRPQGYEGGYGERPQQGYGGGYGERPQQGYGGGDEQRPQRYEGGYGERPQGFEGGFGQGHQGGQGGGMDWSQLGKLVSGFQGAQQQAGGDPSFHHFQNEMANQGHGSQVNGGVLDQLMGHFSHQTGSQFTGSGGQYQMLAKLASDKLGIPVPPQLLEKLLSWKQAGHF